MSEWRVCKLADAPLEILDGDSEVKIYAIALDTHFIYTSGKYPFIQTGQIMNVLENGIREYRLPIHLQRESWFSSVK